MAKYVDIQTNFTSGEIDPLLRSRIDIKQYANGASKLTNVFVQPQGGVKRRPGLKCIYEFETGYNPDQGIRLVPFEFSVSDSYMLMFTEGKMHVIRNGVIVGNINGSGFDYLLIPGLTGDMIDTMCWTQSADTVIVTHEDLQPIKIVRGADHDEWTVTSITFDGIPQYAFTVSTTNPTGSIIPSEISGTVTLYADKGDNTDTAQAGGANTITLASGASATDDAYNNLGIYIKSGTGEGQSKLITDYVGSTKVATVGSDWDVQPDDTSVYTIGDIFDSADEGQYINADPQGRLRITEYVNPVTVRGVTEVPFFSTDPIENGNWEVESGYEDTWSSTKGWPRTCTFHEGRLYLGGSRSRPTTIWGSKIGFFFDFKPVEAYDDDAVEATLDTNTLNTIVDIISGRDLQIFTTGGEFFVPQETQSPVTPTNFFVRTGTRNGVREGLRVIQLDSGTLYIRRQGKALSEFLYSDATLSYVSNSISLLSSHLLKEPKEMALRKATSTDETDLLLIVNEADGTMAAYSLFTQQQVVAPSEVITDGEFVEVAVDVTDIYVVTKRTFNGTEKYFVELFDSTVFTDCAFTGGAAASASSLPHEGAELNVIADGNVLANETVSSGSVTFDRASVSSYEVGLPFTVEVTTNPVEKDIGTGTRLGFKKRIVEINAVLHETQHIIINNVLVPIRQFDTAGTLDNPTIDYTGIKTLYGKRGYSKEATVSVTQEYPLKMTLLGLEYKVSTSGGA
jgi:hypothetical protein